MKNDRGRRWAVVVVAAGASLWGTDTVLRQPLASALPPLLVVFYEHLILTVLLAPVLYRTRAEWTRLRGVDWAALLGIGWGGSALGTLCFTEAIRLGNPTTAVLLQKLQPLFAVLFAAALLGERFRARYWVYLAAAMAAALMVSFGPGAQAPTAYSPRYSTSALLATAAAAFWGSSTVLGRFLAPRLAFFTLTALRIVTALPLLLLLGALAGTLRAPAAAQWPALLALALVPGLAALLLYYRGLRHTPASLAAIAELCFPATAVLLNWLLLDAPVAALQVVGFVLLWVIVALLDRERVSGGAMVS